MGKITKNGKNYKKWEKFEKMGKIWKNGKNLKKSEKFEKIGKIWKNRKNFEKIGKIWKKYKKWEKVSFFCRFLNISFLVFKNFRHAWRSIKNSFPKAKGHESAKLDPLGNFLFFFGNIL